MSDTSRRDRHLFGKGPKRILSLDGGGVRGIVSLAFLEKIEAEVDAIEGRPTRLCDWFDLIGGTSTGAIIATALALGYRVAEIRRFYESLGPKIFKKSHLRIVGWQAKFDARSLERELAAIIGQRQLDSADLQTGLCILLKRLDTGSTWMVMNNPASAFWETPDGAAYTGNRYLPLADVVRASTAAPSFFDPEVIDISPGQPPGLFIDGGLTPHNNPVLMLLMAVLLPPYGLRWQTGPDELLIVSVGTGSFRPTMSAEQARHSSAMTLAIKSLSAMISENQNLILSLMSYLGQSPLPWPINSEIGDVGRFAPPTGELYKFLRYDIRIEADWLQHKLGQVLDATTVETLRQMDNPANMATLLSLGALAAQTQVRGTDLRFAPSSQPGRAEPGYRPAD